MSKFGDLIQSEKPTLLHFAQNNIDACSEMQQILENIAKELPDAVTLVKIDTEKNVALCEALRIKQTPTLMLYKNGSLGWRQSGITDQDSLTIVLKAFL